MSLTNEQSGNTMTNTRPSWHEYWMGMAEQVATRSTCPRATVGAVLVKDNEFVISGYNGAPSGKPHCTDEGCLIEHDHCVRAAHAEANAVFQAAKRGKATNGAICYTTHYPCLTCAVALYQAGVSRVVYLRVYTPNPRVLTLFEQPPLHLDEAQIVCDSDVCPLCRAKEIDCDYH